MKKPMVFVLLVMLVFMGCEETYTPKPRGYFRIELPEATYAKYHGDCPFTFQHNSVSKVLPTPNNPCWVNIHYPAFKATVHITYSGIEGNLRDYLEDARELAFKHTVKADDIQQKLLSNDTARVYGMAYSLEGNSASQYQFFLTDSVNHFFRGSLYFSVAPNADSLKPVTDYVKKDMEKLIDTFAWKQTQQE